MTEEKNNGGCAFITQPPLFGYFEVFISRNLSDNEFGGVGKVKAGGNFYCR